MSIVFNGKAQMGKDGSSLKGYLFIDPDFLPYAIMPANYLAVEIVKYRDCDSSWTFENVLARLNTVANQVIFDDGNFDKSSFEVRGTCKGEFFDLYDYKGNRSINIGGGPNLDVNGLAPELKNLINHTQPTPFACICSYTYQKYRYP